MPATVNRTAILTNLAASVGFGVFCVVTQAPLIQQDVLRRCREVLYLHHLPSEGLSVDGLDVTLTGAPGSALTSAETQVLVADVPGVHAVRIAAGETADRVGPTDLEPATTPEQRELQEKIDSVLENQNITFKSETPILTLEGQAPLKKIAGLLTAAPEMRCEIRGYDQQLNEARQDWASDLQRALAVEDYLVTEGVAEWRLSARVFRNGGPSVRRRHARSVDIVVKAR